ncbi:uncharacterized protein [Panulirus ornatus]|uniref:uncharacterized protein isoform X2 n=1 Tax=Panulirus ornatus TaxID=150431 RepID=UPI003A848A38
MACGIQDGRPGPVLSRWGPARSKALAVAFFEIILLVCFLLFLGYITLFSRHKGYVLQRVALTLSVVVHMVTALLLVHAVRQRRVGLMWAWVWLRVVLLATDSLMGLAEATLGRDDTYTTYIFAFCALSVMSIAIVRFSVIRMSVGTRDSLDTYHALCTHAFSTRQGST